MVKEKFPSTSSKEITEKVHSVQKFVGVESLKWNKKLINLTDFFKILSLVNLDYVDLVIIC